MLKLDTRVSSFAKKASSAEHSGEIVCTIKRSEIVAINEAIEPKIRQNERERTTSMHAASRCIVGGK